jgi:hypothetical protein
MVISAPVLSLMTGWDHAVVGQHPAAGYPASHIRRRSPLSGCSEPDTAMERLPALGARRLQPDVREGSRGPLGRHGWTQKGNQFCICTEASYLAKPQA